MGNCISCLILLIVHLALAVFNRSEKEGKNGQGKETMNLPRALLGDDNGEIALEQERAHDSDIEQLRFSERETKKDQTNVPKLDLTTSEEREESASKKEKYQSREVPVDTTRERPSTGFESGTVSNLSTEGSNLIQKRISSSAESSSVKPGSLRAELEAEVRRIKESFPRGNRRQLTAEIDALKRVRTTKGVLQVGEFMPSFRLRAQNGRMVSSKQLLQNGPLIVSFYHGY